MPDFHKKASKVKQDLKEKSSKSLRREKKKFCEITVWNNEGGADLKKNHAL